MQDFIGSVRRSLVFKPSGAGNDDGVGSLGGFVEKIGSSIHKSKIGLFNKSSVQALQPPPKGKVKKEKEEGGAQIRWRKGELIGCGAFGRVYMGMNLDSGELLAVKQRYWLEGTLSSIIDPIIDVDPIYMKRFLEIGLLCVQENALDRPGIEEVVPMLLGSSSLTLRVSKMRARMREEHT